MAQIVDWHTVLKILVPLIYSLLEYWLGKTNKVKASSLVELIFGVFVKNKNNNEEKEIKDYGMNSELKKLLAALFDMEKLGAMVVKDKGFNVEELPILQGLFLTIPAAIAGAPKAIEELKAMDQAGEEDLLVFLSTQLGLVDPKTANIILKGFKFGFAGYELEQAIVKK